MGTKEIVFLLYTFVLPLLAIVFDDAQWTRKERPAAKKAARATASPSKSESTQVPPGVAHI